MPVLRCLAVLLCFASFAHADFLQTLSNKNVKGKLVALSDQEVRFLDADGKEVKTPLTQVVAIDLNPMRELPADAKYTIVQLFESRLYCEKVTFKGNQVEATLLSGQSLSIPLTEVISFLRNGQDKALREQWDKLLAKVVKEDRVLKLSDGVLEALDGALGDVDPTGEKIQFQLQGGGVNQVKLDKVSGLIFVRNQGAAQTPACVVHDTTGNKIAAKSVAMAGDNFVITTPTGAKLTFAEKALAKLDYNQGKLVFLSDLQPSDVVHESGIGLEIGMKYKKDANLDGEPILLGKTDFAKGLTLHAHTEIEFELGGKYKDFKAVLGVDARAKTQSKAILIIETDGTKILKETIDPKKEVPINVNVRNAQKLRIIVTSDDLLQLHDQATLADARISQ